MTPWELAACVDGWNAAHGEAPKPSPPSAARFEAMKRGEW